MRDIRFLEVGMENFGPYIDPMILTFENSKMTLMTGPNGIGKTMSLDAIPFTLYGVTSKGARGDDVVNNVVGKNCKTWVKFYINDDSYIVTRYHKYTKLGNTVIINKNGVDTKKGHREVVPELERLVCPQKAFMNTLMFGQKVKDFFTDLVDSDKKEIFRKILSLEQYIEYYKTTDASLKEILSELEKYSRNIDLNMSLRDDAIKQIEILMIQKIKFYDEIKRETDELKSSLVNNEKLLKKWQEELDGIEDLDVLYQGIVKELEHLTATLQKSELEKINSISKLNQQKQQKVSEIQKEASDAQLVLKNDLSKALETLQGEAEVVCKVSEAQLNEATIKRTHIEANINAIDTAILTAYEWIDEIKDALVASESGVCPTCQQPVTEECRQKFLADIEAKETHIESLKTSKRGFEDDIKTLNETRMEAGDRYSQTKKQLELDKRSVKGEEKQNQIDIENRLNGAIAKVGEMAIQQEKIIRDKYKEDTTQTTSEIETLEKGLKDCEERKLKIESITKTIENIKREIKGINDKIQFNELKTYDEAQINSYKKKIIDLEGEITKTEEVIQGTDDEIERLRFWKTGFSSTGIPSMLIDEAIPFMNKKVAEYLDMLTNGRYIVSFDTLDETKSGEFRDKISVRVIDTHTHGNSRVQLSGGQTRIVDIATILTLGDLQSAINDATFNILLFDEIFDALDYENVGYVSRVLNQIKLGKSIFIISHQNQAQLEADEHLQFN